MRWLPDTVHVKLVVQETIQLHELVGTYITTIVPVVHVFSSLGHAPRQVLQFSAWLLYNSLVP